MPAFGPTHSDEDVWAIAAFVQRLPELSAEEYATMVRNAGLSTESAGGHGHGGEAGHHREESAHGGGSAAGQPEAGEPAGEGADEGAEEGGDGHTHAPGEGHG
jgi:hypothetical protein